MMAYAQIGSECSELLHENLSRKKRRQVKNTVLAGGVLVLSEHDKLQLGKLATN